MIPGWAIWTGLNTKEREVDMATFAEYEEAIERSNLDLDKNELIAILEGFSFQTQEGWHGDVDQDCECRECRERREDHANP